MTPPSKRLVGASMASIICGAMLVLVTGLSTPPLARAGLSVAGYLFIDLHHPPRVLGAVKELPHLGTG